MSGNGGRVPGLAVPVKALAEAVLEKAVRMGLTWRLRPARVTSAAGDGTIRVLHDGDTQAIRVASLIGRPPVGARVMVVKTPPAGNHIVGYVGEPPEVRRLVAATWATNSVTGIGTAGATTDVVPEVVFQAGRAYEVEIGGGHYSSTAGLLVSRVLQIDGANVAHLLSEQTHNSIVMQGYVQAYLRRTAATDRKVDLTLKVALASGTGTGTVNRYGAADAPRWVAVYEVGPAEKFPWALVVPG